MTFDELKIAIASCEKKITDLKSEITVLRSQCLEPDKGLYVFSMVGEVAILTADVAMAESYLRHNIDIWDVFTLNWRQARVGDKPPQGWDKTSCVYGDHDADITWAQALAKYGVKK